MNSSVEAAPSLRSPSELSLHLGTQIVLGDAKLPWGSQFVYQQSQHYLRRQNQCVLPFSYDVINESHQISRIRTSRVLKQGSMLHQGTAFLLKPNMKKTIAGQIYLTTGINHLTFVIETEHQMMEQSATVILGNCHTSS